VERLMAGSGREVNQAYLMGPDGWNDYQAGVLDKIPVTLIGGNRFAAPAGAGPVNPTVWPNDGLVALSSALATDISNRVLPHRRCLTFDDTHSIFVSNLAGLPWQTGLTWDPRVLDAVHAAIDGADNALNAPGDPHCRSTEFDRHRRVIRPPQRIQLGTLDMGGHRPFGQPRIGQVIVDAPAGIVVESLTAP
jgi:triacylglycerol lipase